MRGLLMVVGSVLVLAAAAVAARPAHAQAPPTPSPQEVAARFVAAVNARDAAAQPCALLTPDLRDLFGVPGYAGLSGWLPETYSEANRQRACDVFVDLFNGYVDSGGVPVWVRTEAGPATVVEQTDALAHLRIPVRRVYDDDGQPLARDETADVFLRLEPGGWRLVWPSLLWELELDRLGEAPANLAGLGPLFDALVEQAGERRREDQALVDAYLGARAPVERAPLPWSGGAHSRAPDPLNDVRERQRQRIEDQAAATGDLRAAALRTDRATVTFELRFRERVPDRLGVSFALEQEGPHARQRWRWTTRSAGWTAAVADGFAIAWPYGYDARTPLPAMRASATGDTLRIAFPARAVRGAVRLDDPLRWSVSVSTPPLVADAVPPVNLVDDLPEERAVERTGGVLHPAGTRETVPACTRIQEGLRNTVPQFVHVGDRVPVRVNNRWNKRNIADVTITSRGVVRPVQVGDVIDRTFHVRAPERPGRFRVAVAWRQVDDHREPRIPPCAGRDEFVVTAFPAGARLGDERRPRVDGAWRVTRAEGNARREGWSIVPRCAAGACSLVLRAGSGEWLPYELGRGSYRRVVSVAPRLSGSCTGRWEGKGRVETVRPAFRERVVELITVTAERTDAIGRRHATRLERRLLVTRSPTWEARALECMGSVRQLGRAVAVRVR